MSRSPFIDFNVHRGLKIIAMSISKCSEPMRLDQGRVEFPLLKVWKGEKKFNEEVQYFGVKIEQNVFDQFLIYNMIRYLC